MELKVGCWRILWCFVTILGLSSPAMADKVVGVSKKKALVKIDEGSSSGFVKNAKVCFFNAKGKRVTCGKVRAAKPNSASVRVSKKRVGRISKGMVVKLAGAKSQIASGVKVGTDNVAEAVGGKFDHRTNIKGAFVISPVTPATYNKLTYAAPPKSSDTELEDGQSTLWKSEGSSSLSFFGMQLEGEFGLFSSHALSFGLRMILYRDFIAQSDYDQRDFKKYVQSEQTGSALGFYTDYTYLDLNFTESFFFRMSTGLDIDMSTVTFSAEQKHSEEGTSTKIAEATSKLTVLSWRLLNANLNFLLFKPVGVTFGLNALLPLAEFSKSASVKNDDPQASYLDDDNGQADLEEALGHKKSGFAAQVYIGSFFAF